MMVHYYYIDHSKQQSSGQSESSERSNNHQLSFNSSSEILHGRFFLFGQSVWIICQLLGRKFFFSDWLRWVSSGFDVVDKLLTISDLDPIRRYLAPCERPKPNSRYSSIQVDSSLAQSQHSSTVLIRIRCAINTRWIYRDRPQVNPLIQKSKPVDQCFPT